MKKGEENEDNDDDYETADNDGFVCQEYVRIPRVRIPRVRVQELESHCFEKKKLKIEKKVVCVGDATQTQTHTPHTRHLSIKLKKNEIRKKRTQRMWRPLCFYLNVKIKKKKKN